MLITTFCETKSGLLDKNLFHIIKILMAQVILLKSRMFSKMILI